MIVSLLKLSRLAVAVIFEFIVLMLSNLEREKKYLRARTSNKTSLIDINPRKKKSQQEDPLSKLELSVCVHS